MKSRRSIGGAILLGLVGGTSAASPQDLMDHMIPLEVVLGRAHELGLTPEQREALQRHAADSRQRLSPLVADLQRETDRLIELLRESKPEDAAVFAQFERLTEVESQLKRVRLQMTLQAKAALTPEQQSKALALRRNASPDEKFGRRPDSLPARLQRVKQGLEQWKREGRDVTVLRQHWERFLDADARGHFGEARRALDEALAILDGKPPAPAPSAPTPGH